MIPATLNVVIGAVAVGLATMFAAASCVLNSITPGTVRKLEEENEKLAGRLNSWYEEAEKFQLLLRLLLVLDLVLLIFCAMSWYMHYQNTHQLGTLVVPFVISGVFYLVITEWLGRHPSFHVSVRLLQISMPVAWALKWLIAPVFFPVLFIQQKMLSWQQGTQEEQTGRTTAEDEIKSLVEEVSSEHETDSALDEDERRMIRGVFDLNDKFVREIMTPRVDIDAVEENATLDEVKQTIIHSGHSRIPVYRESVDRIVGVIYAKDLLQNAGGGDEDLSQFYHKPAFIPETKKIVNLLSEFQQTRIHLAVVIDEYGGTSGVVTFEDILEEIVGEIRDEYDENEEILEPRFQEDGTAILDARMNISQFNEVFEASLPEDEDYDTVGGYIVAEYGRIPPKNEVIENGNVAFDILEADQRRVRRVRAWKKEPSQEEEEQ